MHALRNDEEDRVVITPLLENLVMERSDDTIPNASMANSSSSIEMTMGTRPVISRVSVTEKMTSDIHA